MWKYFYLNFHLYENYNIEYKELNKKLNQIIIIKHCNEMHLRQCTLIKSGLK